ncbi:DUF2975 domain-containing protein [Hymenobacter gummosus]|uniref:DUF2975 domain-containing protein n=1 Tax=Hymenobacter gummosus TaxID=1776032 RepID=A0A3S0HMT8_9BACT|nr:DUF2975 domain-containing protein [Hymenobacter gummosus]RTQ49221.1 DUF2975 domain-containing protein [Hymenobacter gummosus]
MKPQATFVLNALHVIFWIVFIGLCIKVGAVLVSFFVSLFVSAEAAHNMYMGLDMAELQQFSQHHYVAVVSFMVYFLGVQAYLAYQVIRILQRLDLAAPFSGEIAALITRISREVLTAGVVMLVAGSHGEWLLHRGVGGVPVWSGGEFLFLAAIIFLVAQIYQRGADLQAENDLTV